MQSFKDLYNPKSISQLSLDIKEVYPQFDHHTFCKGLHAQLSEQINDLAMKDRVRLIAVTLKDFLPNNYSKAIRILVDSLAAESDHEEQWVSKQVKGVAGFMVWPLCQYVEDNGLEFFEESMLALYEMTKRFTAEFSIRPFIKHYDNKVYELLQLWALDPSPHVRRLVSEGTRPRLPWGMKVDNILTNLERNIVLLEQLKDDPQEYVRRSVANHLNDISKLDKKLMLSTCEKWSLSQGQTEQRNMQWIVRHASRTLLKQGDKDVLRLNGLTVYPQVIVKNLQLSAKKIQEGESFKLSFDLHSCALEKQNLLIDYIIEYPKKHQKMSAKTFRLKKLLLPPGEKVKVEKMISFKKVTTRVHYAGKHLLKVKIGANILAQCEFFLIKY